MMELQEAPLRAAAAMPAYEGTPPTVPDPDRAPNLGRDVSRANGCLAPLARPIRRGKLLLGEVLDQRCQGPIENLSHISVGNLVA
jgi:hypothetical protein